MKRTIAGSFSMKQLNATPPNALPDGKPKRGRPSKPDALTGAERAKRFRDARRALPKSVTVTKNACDECVALRDEVRRLNHRLGEKEIQILADGITLKKSRATVLELRRELALRLFAGCLAFASSRRSSSTVARTGESKATGE